MARYDFRATERKWQARWQERQTYKTPIDDRTKPKFYVLDMFPYPSGAGLHVGHPLGYIASDIMARYKRLTGHNVIHPMGFDAFGLPAENYAIQTGTHPAITTEVNIKRFKEQLNMLGMSYDPELEFRTCDPSYYKWTQWIFLQLFNSWYDKTADKAQPIETLEAHFAQHGSSGVAAACANHEPFTAADWNGWDKAARQAMLLNYRLAYQSYTMVNWCPALGTVLANEEMKDGVSERGGHPIERKPMRQWSLRITAYAERLLRDLDTLDWNPAVVEMQRNWIGKSTGATVYFPLQTGSEPLEVFTTRPDTLFGVTFMVIAPEHSRVDEFTTPDQAAAVGAYVQQTASRSERERQADVKRVSGVFTGSYALHPITQQPIPIWIGEYVLAGYGTGAIMAVPAHDSRDYAFARHFNLPITQVVAGGDISKEAHEAKEGTLIDSEFLNGLQVPEAIARCIQELEARKQGRGKTQYKLRDAIFSRQRYWGEPFPIVYEGDTAYALPETELPVTLPNVESYKPTGTGASPLAAVTDWVNLPDGRTRETDTMPGWAGSSWYFLRYISPKNDGQFVDGQDENYWMPVDLYIGGTEHAVGHLLYARFWTQFLYDRGFVQHREPFKRLVNQGMILGRSSLAYRRKDGNVFVSKGLVQNPDEFIPVHVNVAWVKDEALDLEAFRAGNPDARTAQFELEDDKDGNPVFRCGDLVEKMSKSFQNVVVPDVLCEQYGADTFRMYEMFLGPLEMSKPWNTNGITGVFNFVNKAYALFYNDANQWRVVADEPTRDELKALHRTIKRVTDDIERLSFNTCISHFMILVNDLTKYQCHKASILKPFVVLLAPFAPHLAEELWEALGETGSVCDATYPTHDPAYLEDDSIEYPVSINGKTRFKLVLPADLAVQQIEAEVLASADAAKYIDGKEVSKVVVVPKKIINLVIKG